MRKGLLKSKMWLMLVAIAALSVGSSVALAHEHRDVGNYTMVVGFETEPAYEGAKNAASVRITRKSEEVDVNAHGAVFDTPSLNPGETFTFEVPEDLEGKTIPFHNHFHPEATGTIEVTDEADLSGTVDIKVLANHFEPSNIAVKGSTTLVFTNDTDTVQMVSSGIMSAMGDMGSMGDAGAMSGEMTTPAATPEPITGLEKTLQVEVTHVPTSVSKVMPLTTVFNDPGHYVAEFVPTAPGVYQFRVFGTIEGTDINETFVSAGGGGGFGDVESTADIQFPEQLPAVREIESAVKGAQDTASMAEDKASSASTLGIIGIILGAVGIASGVGGVAIAMRKR